MSTFREVTPIMCEGRAKRARSDARGLRKEADGVRKMLSKARPGYELSCYGRYLATALKSFEMRADVEEQIAALWDETKAAIEERFPVPKEEPSP